MSGYAMKNYLLSLPVLACCLLLIPGMAPAAASLVPVPPAEQGLPTEIAEDWFTVSPTNKILEGAIFDAQGNLLFCNVSDRKVMRIGPEKQAETVLSLEELAPGGLALHEDGRLFIAALDLAGGKGAILAWSPLTGKTETILPVEAGYWPNDLVLDMNGGLYFSNFRRQDASPAGGIYYMPPDYSSVTPVMPKLAQANGVALSPDGKTIWATEFAKNRLHRAQLQDETTLTPTGLAVPWHFTGPAPDSMRVDSDGNVYVAIYGQGRVLIFNKNGLPVGQILLPGRDQGLNLLSTSLAIDPRARELFIVSSNDDSEKEAAIFRAPAIAKGQKPQYLHK